VPRDELDSLVHSFRCAGTGVAAAFSSQRSLRIQVVIGLLVIVCGLLLGLTLLEWALLALTISMVLAVEVLNTAIEAAVDLVCPSLTERVRFAKDVAAGATLIAALGSVAVGVIVFLPRILLVLGLRG